MQINIPQSPMVDSSGCVTTEWLIFFNQLVRQIEKIEQVQKLPSKP